MLAGKEKPLFFLLPDTANKQTNKQAKIKAVSPVSTANSKHCGSQISFGSTKEIRLAACIKMEPL